MPSLKFDKFKNRFIAATNWNKCDAILLKRTTYGGDLPKKGVTK
jgi:hypothetical protein